MRTLSYTLAAGETILLNMTFRTIRLLSAADNSINIEFFADSNKTAEPALSVGAGYYASFDEMADRVDITSTVAQTIQIGLAMNKSSGFDRIVGTVQVVDGRKSRSLAGIAFWGVTYSPVVAASLPCAQLFNKSTTKNLIIESVLITSAFSQIIHIIRNSVSLATLSSAPLSKYGLATLSVNAELRIGTNATKTAGDDLMVCAVVANTTFQLIFNEPFVVKPNEGLVVQGFLSASDVYANFEFLEENV